MHLKRKTTEYDHGKESVKESVDDGNGVDDELAELWTFAPEKGNVVFTGIGYVGYVGYRV